MVIRFQDTPFDDGNALWWMESRETRVLTLTIVFCDMNITGYGMVGVA